MRWEPTPGYTLVLKNQYISYGLDDTMFETYLTKISEYYTGFELTPMSFTLAEPDFDLHVGDRIQVYDEEEQGCHYRQCFQDSDIRELLHDRHLRRV